MRRLYSLSSALSLIIIVMFMVEGQSQVTTATIYGRVVDETGGVLPGVEVKVVLATTGFTQSTVTNDRGEFTLTFLPVGSYEVTIGLTGFKTYREQDMELMSGQKLNRVFTLSVGEIQEVVTVTSNRVALNTSTAEEDISHPEQVIKELPLLRRDFANLLNVGNGIFRSGDGISINGLPEAGFTFTVDGTDASGNMEIQSIASYQGYNFIKGTSIEAVEEVQVSKNIFSAEIANAMGGNVNLITKSGTNQLHGSVFWNYQAGGLNARNQFVADKQPLVFHQFGGSAGGAVVKDKMFLFGTYEGYRLTASQLVNGNVPTQEFRDEAIAAVPAYKQIFDLFPLPTDPVSPGDITGFFESVGAEEARENHATVRWDYNMSDRDMFSAKYTRARPFRLTPRHIEENPRTWTGKTERINASYTKATASLSAETRFGYNQSNTDRSDEIFKLGIPAIEAFDFGTAGETFIITGDITSIEEVIALNRGRHSIKFGGIYLYWRSRRANEEVPVYSYSTESDLFANTPSSSRFVIGPLEYEIQIWQNGYFVQDDIRLTPNLMLNLGVRYDYYSVPRERDDRLVNREEPNGFGPKLPPDRSYDADYNNFSPRLGFAWTMDEARRTVLRGGFGVFHNPHPIQGAMVNLIRDLNDGVEIPTEVSFSRLAAQDLGINYPTTNAEVRPLVAGSDRIGGWVTSPNFPNPYSLQWTLGVQRQLSNSMVWDVSYVGNHGVKLIMVRSINLPDRMTGVVPEPGYFRFERFDNSESTSYHSLQTSLKKRFSNNLSFDVFYTWSRSIGFTANGDLRLVARPQDNDRLFLDRGPTAKDIPHRFVTNFVYEVPFARNLDSSVARSVLDGWQLSGIVNAQSGEPFDVTQSSSYPSSRPDFIGNSYDDAYLNEGLQYLNRSMFAQVPIIAASGATARAGNVGRNAFRRPGYWNLDFTVSKFFNINEETRLQFRVDMFNAFNQTNFFGVTTNVRSGSFGRFTSTRGARVMQFGVRLNF